MNRYRGINEPPIRTKKRFIAKVNKDTESGCWEWTAGCDREGYGLFKYKRATRRASRISWILYRGEIPNDLWILHKCDNRLCVKPSHLFLGTPSDNSLDREKKGRGRDLVGENNGYSKLNDATVLQIRSLKASGVKQKDIAEQFGVTASTVSVVVNRKIWKHI